MPEGFFTLLGSFLVCRSSQHHITSLLLRSPEHINQVPFNGDGNLVVKGASKRIKQPDSLTAEHSRSWSSSFRLHFACA
jgi:hypothetical protein